MGVDPNYLPQKKPQISVYGSLRQANFRGLGSGGKMEPEMVNSPEPQTCYKTLDGMKYLGGLQSAGLDEFVKSSWNLEP